MTAAAGAGGQRHRGWLFRLGMLLGHYANRWSVYLTILMWTYIASSWWLPEQVTTQGPLRWAVFVLVLIYVVGFTCQVVLHERHLCLRDLDDAPLLDPQAAVDQHRRALRIHHNRRQYLVALITGVLPLAILLVMTGQASYPVGVKLALTALAAIGVAANCYVGYIQATHRRLQPWCPWCRRNDGGDPVVSPTPDPAGTVQH